MRGFTYLRSLIGMVSTIGIGFLIFYGLDRLLGQDGLYLGFGLVWVPLAIRWAWQWFKWEIENEEGH